MHTTCFPTLSSAFPVHDWQFWVVTVFFIGAIAWLARGFLPGSKARKARGKSTRVSLTVGGKSPDEHKP